MSYRSTIARQPESLADSFSAAGVELQDLDLTAFNSGLIGITGIGASYAAATVVAGELTRRGRRAIPLRQVEMMGGDVADAVIALSHRGRSVETVDALNANPKAAKLAITKDPESPLAKASGTHVMINNGSDATPSSTGYTGTLAVAGLVVDKICGGTTADWNAIPQLAAEVLSNAGKKMERLGELFRDRRAIDCVGAGASLGTADGASLLIREASRIPAGPSETRHYLHGPMESMDGRTGVVVFGDGRELQMARQLEEIGCPVLLVTANPDIQDGSLLTVMRVPEQENRIARAILDILTAQLFAAQLSDAAGLTDTKFRYPQTDTKIKAA
ncbi:SIS domain-containing protein [Aliirhizobium smilacinae]|uniref:Glutamine--fructose-6-phosphate aminotransferase [isomerizing] n=1 Tax=Aliirhizobium smilacinae TaxID=1395944 RepID=A0A5C4XMF1_9HYPH|nr:glucosamine--fructose-6-phosphate aminotransferase [Rhizobium smilacinae]TNM63800.1 glucosamine--fructose-6-phosphate aminotransferase [Rhizobium smilacinae]